MRKIGLVAFALYALGGVALADPAAESKAATAIENREPTGVGDRFKQGETVFVWSAVTDGDGKTLEHVWKRDGKEVTRARLPVKGKRWRVNSKRRSAEAGSWVVEVSLDGAKLGEVAFTVE